MRSRDYRRAKRLSKMRRRLTEDRNQHYTLDLVPGLRCRCWTDPKAMARFAEQPKHCSCWMCGNPRRQKLSHTDRLTVQERRAFQS